MAARVDERLSEILGHHFAQPELLVEALTHASAAPRGRRRGAMHGYERLEFLGDRVLGLVVAEMLWRRFPDEAEGAMTRRHTQLVRRESLVEVARALDLAQFILLSPGEEAANTRAVPGILADVAEAVIAALYLDGGLAAAARFIHRHWEPLLEADAAPPRDPKTELQEWAQARGRPLPAYETLRTEGPSHDPRFWVRVTVDGWGPETATGPSKRSAEVAAAAILLRRIAAGAAR